MIREIRSCRSCGNPSLRPILELGEVHLPGFPGCAASDRAPRVPVDLVRCDESARADACGLVQLRHAVDVPELRGSGYRDGAPGHKKHFAGIAERLQRHVSLGHTDVVLDIGSNDGALLSCFAPGGPLLIGMDPLSAQSRRQFRADVQLIPQAFSPDLLRRHLGGKKVKVITAVGVLDRLDDGLAFFKSIRQVLDAEGIACLEQVYLPALIKQNAYDSFLPEHGAYYTVRQVLFLAEQSGLKVLDVFTNDFNGGSFAVTVARSSSPRGRPPSSLGWYLENESGRRLAEPATWAELELRMNERKEQLVALLDRIYGSGERAVGWGVTPAGSALLERCGIGPERLPTVACADPDVVGRTLPGTGIPVVSESEARSREPHYLLALARQARAEALRGQDEFLLGGGKVIFPLPDVDIVSA